MVADFHFPRIPRVVFVRDKQTEIESMVWRVTVIEVLYFFVFILYSYDPCYDTNFGLEPFPPRGWSPLLLRHLYKYSTSRWQLLREQKQEPAEFCCTNYGRQFKFFYQHFLESPAVVLSVKQTQKNKLLVLMPFRYLSLSRVKGLFWKISLLRWSTGNENATQHR